MPSKPAVALATNHMERATMIAVAEPQMTADGLRLRQWRHDHALTLQQLADYLGVVWLTVQRWETGRRPMPGYLWLALERLDQVLPRQMAPAVDQKPLYALEDNPF